MSGRCQGFHFVLQRSFDHPLLNTGKPLQKLLNGGAITKILEEGGHGYTRGLKHPGSSEFARVPLDSLAQIPVCHLVISLSQRSTCRRRARLMSVWQPRPPAARASNHAIRSATRRGVICALDSISLLSRWFRDGPFGLGAHVELAGDDVGDEAGAVFGHALGLAPGVVDGAVEGCGDFVEVGSDGGLLGVGWGNYSKATKPFPASLILLVQLSTFSRALHVSSGAHSFVIFVTFTICPLRRDTSQCAGTSPSQSTPEGL